MLKQAVQRILRTRNVELKDLIKQDLRKIAGELYAQELISKDTEADVKVPGVAAYDLASNLVNACQPSLEILPEKKFPRFIGVLKKFTATEDLAKAMEAEFKEAGMSWYAWTFSA